MRAQKLVLNDSVFNVLTTLQRKNMSFKKDDGAIRQVEVHHYRKVMFFLYHFNIIKPPSLLKHVSHHFVCVCVSVCVQVFVTH